MTPSPGLHASSPWGQASYGGWTVTGVLKQGGGQGATLVWEGNLLF
jgi:hypothetical protein